MSRDAAAFNDKARGAYIGYVPKPGDRIPVVQDTITSEQMWEHFIRKRAPVVIDGLLKDYSWNGKAWADLSYLRDRAGGARVKIEPIHPNGHFGTAAEREEVPLELFLDMLEDEEMAGQFYLTTQYDQPTPAEQDSDDEDEDESQQDGITNGAASSGKSKAKPASSDDSETLKTSSSPRPRSASPAFSDCSTLTGQEMAQLDPLLPAPTGALADDFPLPAPAIMGGLALQQCNLWLGNCKQGKSSGLHHDHADNLYILLSGRKRFLLWPPVAYAWLQPRGNIEGLCPNGLLLYTPPGEYPSWHPHNNRLPLRGDGLSEPEAAEWRVRARQRILRREDNAAAKASGEGDRRPRDRKGKGKQTQAQVDALERLAAAEIDHQAILLEERGLYIDDEDDEEDDSLSRIDPTRLRKPTGLIGKRRVQRLDSELDIHTDDELLTSEEEEEEEEEETDSDESDTDVSKLNATDRAARVRRKYFAKMLDFVIGRAYEGAEQRNALLHITDEFWCELARSVCGKQEPREQWHALEARLREPILRLIARPGDLNVDEMILAVAEAWAAIGMDARGYYLDAKPQGVKRASPDNGQFEDATEEEDEQVETQQQQEQQPRNNDLAAKPQGVKRGSTEDEQFEDADEEDGPEAEVQQQQSRNKRAKRSPPLHIPPGMLPGGLRGRVDGDEFDDDEYEEYDAPAYDDMLMTMGSGDEEEAMDGDFELRAQLLQESFAAAVAAENAQADADEAAPDSARPTQLAQRLAARMLEEEDSIDSHDDEESISRSVAEDRMARAGQSFEGIETDSLDSEDVRALPTESSSSAAEVDNEPPSFSKISPQALHRYFGLPDDPTQPNATPPPLAPEEIGPQPRCPPPLVVDLRPGQMLYLPASWWHEVTSFTEEPEVMDRKGKGKAREVSHDAPVSSGGPPVHMAFNYWFHPPTALFRGVAPSVVPARGAATQAAAREASSGAGGAGSARQFTGREVGKSSEPYLDFEVWDEIKLAIKRRLKKERERAEEELMQAELEAEGMAQDGDEEEE